MQCIESFFIIHLIIFFTSLIFVELSRCLKVCNTQVYFRSALSFFYKHSLVQSLETLFLYFFSCLFFMDLKEFCMTWAGFWSRNPSEVQNEVS